MLLSPGRGQKQLHVALWGSVNTLHNTLEMYLGLPASTLAFVGIRGLPADYMLPLRISGTCTAPSLEWGAAVRKLAVLSARTQLLPSPDTTRSATSASSATGGVSGDGVRTASESQDGESQGDVQQQQGQDGRRQGSQLGRGLGLMLSNMLEQVDLKAQEQLVEVPAPVADRMPWQ